MNFPFWFWFPDVTVLIQSWWGALWCSAWLSALPCLDLVRKTGLNKESVLLSLMLAFLFSILFLFAPEKRSQVGQSQRDYKRKHVSLRERFGRSVCSLHVLLFCHVPPVHTMQSQWWIFIHNIFSDVWGHAVSSVHSCVVAFCFGLFYLFIIIYPFLSG